ncbi:MAG: RNA methyltransferase [Gemmatimonadales bacterium]
MASNLIKQVRNLQRRKNRKRRGPALAEGVRLVEDAVAAGISIHGVLFDQGLAKSTRGGQLLETLASHAVPLEEVSARELSALADTETPQGILAVVEMPAWDLADISPLAGHPVIVLDGVQDPGNVGTLLRTAFALGAPGAITLPGTAALTGPKVMRAAMGATFRLPTALLQDGEFTAWVTEHSVEVWAAAAEGVSVTRLAVPDVLAIVVGNEGAGVRPFVRSVARHAVAIPLARGAESLNVAVAAGILLHEVRRG